MNELKLIEQRKVLGEEFRIYGDFENPLFVATDVAEWIEHSNTTEMLRGIDDDEKLTSIILRAGQRRMVAMLTEDGLYEVLMQSRKPIAKEFKREVKQILKTIRKHGLYATDELLDNPDLIIQMASKLKEEREARKALEVENDTMKPKALFADAVSASHTSILVGDLAKLLRQNGIDIGAHRLFEKLREKGFLMKSGSSKNMPTQASMDRGLFEIKEGSYINSDGVNVVTKTTKVTGKGQVYFVNLFLEKQIVREVG